MPAPAHLVEIGEGRVGHLEPAPRGPDPLAGELGEADRDRDRRRRLAGRASVRLSILPVPPRRGGPRARQPVQGDVVENVASGQTTGGRTVDADLSIIGRFGAELRGYVNYYLLAQNMGKLYRLKWTMETSMLKTLANKHKRRVDEDGGEIPHARHYTGRRAHVFSGSGRA